jgi:hypothetical protein
VSGIQRLFDNPYTRSARLDTLTMRTLLHRLLRDAPERARAPRRSRRLERAGAFAVLLTPLLLLSGAFPTAAGAPGVVSSFSGVSTYDSGRLSVVFPSPLPGVELFQDANNSVGAALFIDHVIEFEQGNSDHPAVVQVATPTSTTPFDLSNASSGQDSFGLALNGTLPVVATRTSLWGAAAGLPSNLPLAPNVPVVGGSRLVVSYALITGPGNSQGLELSWQIHGWPWLSTNDLLGLEFDFSAFNATGFNECQSAPNLSAGGGAACNGTVLNPGSILWNTARGGSVVALGPSGLTASFGWSAHVASAEYGSRAVVAGTYYSSAGHDRTTVAVPAGGSGNVTASATLLLSAPPFPAVPAALQGDGAAYGGAFAGFALAAFASVALYRRRETRSRKEL